MLIFVELSSVISILLITSDHGQVLCFLPRSLASLNCGQRRVVPGGTALHSGAGRPPAGTSKELHLAIKMAGATLTEEQVKQMMKEVGAGPAGRSVSAPPTNGVVRRGDWLKV